MTRAVLWLLAIVFTLGGIAAGVSAAALVASLGGNPSAALVAGLLVGANGGILALICGALAGVHGRLERLTEDVADALEDLEEALTPSDPSGTLGG